MFLLPLLRTSYSLHSHIVKIRYDNFLQFIAFTCADDSTDGLASLSSEVSTIGLPANTGRAWLSKENTMRALVDSAYSRSYRIKRRSTGDAYRMIPLDKGSRSCAHQLCTTALASIDFHQSTKDLTSWLVSRGSILYSIWRSASVSPSPFAPKAAFPHLIASPCVDLATPSVLMEKKEKRLKGSYASVCGPPSAPSVITCEKEEMQGQSACKTAYLSGGYTDYASQGGQARRSQQRLVWWGHRTLGASSAAADLHATVKKFVSGTTSECCVNPTKPLPQKV